MTDVTLLKSTDTTDALIRNAAVVQWGKQGTLTVGGTVTPDRTWVMGDSMTRDQLITEVTLNPAIAGNIEIAGFSKSGDLFTKKERITVAAPTGESTVSLGAGIVIAEGEYFGWYADPGMMTHEPSEEIDDWASGYYAYSGGQTESFTDASLAPIVGFRIRLGMIDHPVTGATSHALSEAERAHARLDSVGSDGWRETKQFIMVFQVGQSNGSGRGTGSSAYTIESGRGYKYDAGSGDLEHLVDPTGTDVTAQTGRSSVGPAMAQAVLDATNGAVGLILVNACEGGTDLGTDWASGGSDWTAAQTMLSNAITSANTLNLDVIGCIGVIIQGERDANLGTSLADYKTYFLDLLSRMKTETGLGDRFKLLMSQTGFETTGDTTGYQDIRQAQYELAQDYDEIIMAHSRAKRFVADGLMEDTVHYDEVGLDEVGYALGLAVATYGVGSKPDGLTV